MTREETKRIIYVLSSSYPNWKIDNPSDLVDAWHFMLSDYTYNDVAIAAKTYINTSNSAFAPSVSQLIGMVHKPQELTVMNEMEAWALVYKAICNSNYNSEREYEKLPEIVRKAIGSAANLREMAKMDMDTVNSVEQSHFIRNYRVEVDRARTISQMPTEARMKLQQYQQNLLEEK